MAEWGIVALIWIPIAAVVATFYAFVARSLLRKIGLAPSDRLRPYFLVYPILILLSILADPRGLAAAWKIQALEGFLQTTLGGAFYPLSLIDPLIAWWRYFLVFFVVIVSLIFVAKRCRPDWYSRARKTLWLSFFSLILISPIPLHPATGTLRRAIMYDDDTLAVETLETAPAGWVIEYPELLNFAAGYGQHGVVRILLSKGWNPATQDSAGDIPLHNAALWGHSEIVRLLVQSDSPLHSKNNKGDTPLHNAMICKPTDIAELLIQSGSPLDATNNQGDIPLHTAAKWGRKDIVKLLLESGSPLDVENQKGETPLDVAFYFHRDETADLIREASASAHK